MRTEGLGPPTRMLMVSVPPMLADLVDGLLAEIGGVEVTRLPDGLPDLTEAADDLDAHAVIVGTARAELPEQLLNLLRARPRLHALAVTCDGRDTFRYLPVGELDAQLLVRAVLEARAVQ